MRWFLVLLMAGSAVSAVAAESSKFDGVYNVSLGPQAGFDGPRCPKYEVKSLQVAMGQIKAGADQSMISGTIDDRGRLQGQFNRPNEMSIQFRGSLQANKNDPNAVQIKATIIDEKAGCGWALSIVRQ